MPESREQAGPAAPNVVLLLDRVAFDRFGEVLRHLIVGLVDQAVGVRLISADARVERFKLGPVQAVLHEPICWPFVRRRTQQLIDSLAARPPNIVHALTSESIGLGDTLATAFDADLLMTVSSVFDCESLQSPGAPIAAARFAAASEPLHTLLKEQLGTGTGRIVLIRPGVIAAKRVACFADAHRIPSILSFTAFEEQSGSEQLIEAADILRRRHHEFMLFLVGTGRREALLRARIRDFRLGSHVTLLQPVSGLQMALLSTDLFVRPAPAMDVREDSLQAMAAGVAVVSCADVVSDHLHHGETAVVCESSLPETLASAIEQLLADRTYARRLAATAMEYVRQYHSASAWAERTAEVYRERLLARTTLSLKE